MDSAYAEWYRADPDTPEGRSQAQRQGLAAEVVHMRPVSEGVEYFLWPHLAQEEFQAGSQYWS